MRYTYFYLRIYSKLYTFDISILLQVKENFLLTEKENVFDLLRLELKKKLSF